MKPYLQVAIVLAALFLSNSVNAQNKIRIFDTVLFYDGYAQLVNHPTAPDVIRHRNDLITRKLTDRELHAIGNTLNMRVTIKAACDNYDRIGNVNLVFTRKNAADYHPDSVSRIEIGRFVTPFMNKNKQPDTVVYNYSIDNVARILKGKSITTKFDIWAEMQVFGVPYAAQKEVAGCAGRDDVFYGTLDFITGASSPAHNDQILLPVSFQYYMKSYDSTGTDTLRKATKTFTMYLPNNLSNATLTLITSNHGAKEDGEEYNRRQHYLYVDGKQVLTYKPGRINCESFRAINTQRNGIYGKTPMSDSEWQSFNNWCPGDAIPTRTVQLGSLKAGLHTFRLSVPDAVFVSDDGYFPISMYLQGKTAGNSKVKRSITVNQDNVKGILIVAAVQKIKSVDILDAEGKLLLTSEQKQVNISRLKPGSYQVCVTFEDGIAVIKPFIKR